MSLSEKLCAAVRDFLRARTAEPLPTPVLEPTAKGFAGDVTLVLFPLVKVLRVNPVTLGEEIGDFLKQQLIEVTDYELVKGFLNLSICDDYYLELLCRIRGEPYFGRIAAPEDTAATWVEYSSPNTNKPLHLGHVRNNLLGYSVASILEAAGHRVVKAQIINDRGIHICKSMLAWQKFGGGKTPEEARVKGDHWVGSYYVRFDVQYRAEVAVRMAQGYSRGEAEAQAPTLLEAQDMLRKWEAGDAQTLALWKEINAWVYRGFSETYARLGVDFDQTQYESDTYLRGKELVRQGLEKGVFYRKPDGSVWCDLTDVGLDEKVVLRSDGTSVYLTQDLGTAVERFEKHAPDRLIYTVGNEQDYHFEALFAILRKLGYPWVDQLYHLSYGMVDLPSGKMKSREGMVVDADELMDEMQRTAREKGVELGKLEGCSQADKDRLYEVIGLGALKYHLLKVDPRKRILFNPEESIDFTGDTGPFLQYAHARIQSLLRKAGELPLRRVSVPIPYRERDVLKQLARFPEVIQEAAQQLNPARLAHYSCDLVRSFNHFYQNSSILHADTEDLKDFRLQLVACTAKVLASALQLLGIAAPQQM